MADRDVFGDELRRLIDQVNNPGPMYEGWQNPTNKPGDKASNGVYPTPFDRQGGPAVAQEELETQARDILARLLGQEGYGREAIDQVLQVLKGTTQSPADAGNNAPPLSPAEQFRYGAGLSVPQGQASDPMWQKFQAFMSAEEEKRKHDEDERKERDRKERDEKERKERDEREDKEMSALAQRIFPALQSAVSAMVDQAMSAYGFRANGAQSAAPASNNTATQAGLSVQGQASGVAYQGLPGMQLPPGMQVPANNAAMSAGDNPNQAKASAFMQEAMSVVNSMPEGPQRGQLAEEIRPLYAGILSGAQVQIGHPMLQKVAQNTGVNYVSFGIGGVR